MRTFIVVLLLAAAGYYLYTRHAPQASGDELPAEIAWRSVSRDERGAVTSVEVVAVSGNRWRSEFKSPGTQHAFVVVSDGRTAAASNPRAPAASFDPRPPVRLLLKSLLHMSPEATEQIAGRPYLRFPCTFNGSFGHVWADPQTRFPYRIRGLAPFIDITCTTLPAPSERDTPDLFSVRALTPLLTRYTTPQ